MTELEKTEFKIAELQKEHEEAQKKIKQYEHQAQKIEQRNSQLYRKIRTHRLIERGAILESLIPNAESYDNKIIQQFLSTVLTEKTVSDFFEKDYQSQG